jgi:hypothetical protein
VTNNLSDIQFLKNYPSNGKGFLCCYDYDPINIDGWKTVDLRTIISEKEDEWLSQIDGWHRIISNNAISLSKWWPLSSGSRLHIWSNGTRLSFKSLFFALALHELKKRYPNNSVRVVGAPNEVQIYLNQSSLKPSSDFSLSAFYFYIEVLKKLLFYLILLMFKKKKKIEKVRVLVVSMILGKKRENDIEDHFFGNIFSGLIKKREKKLGWFYINPLIRNDGFKKFNCDDEKIKYYIGDFIDFAKLIKCFLIALNTRKIFKNLLDMNSKAKIGGLLIKTFDNDFKIGLIINSSIFEELIQYEVWIDLLKTLEPKFLIYPYEEKTAERAMLLAIKDNRANINSIGFAHAAYSKGHLYLRSSFDINIPKPKTIAVTGESAENFFIKLGYSPKKLAIIGSPRYKESSIYINSSIFIRRQRLLLLIGHGFELINFSLMISRQKGLLDNYEFTIRRYPYAWIKEQDKAEEKLREHGINFNVSYGSLADEIKKTDIVIFDSTSAGIEAALCGKIVIQLNLSDILETNHFILKNDLKKMYKCNSLEEMTLVLNSISLQDTEGYQTIASEQRDICQKLYSPLDYCKLDELLN